jgi:hypothetical protein
MLIITYAECHKECLYSECRMLSVIMLNVLAPIAKKLAFF